MPITVRAPDGTLVNFPDGMSDGDITRVMRQNYPPSPAAAPKVKPKKKEEESFLSDVGTKFKGGIGSVLSDLGSTFKQAANLTKSIPVIGDIDRGVDSLLGDYLRKSGKGIEARAEAELSEASLENRARQQREIAGATPGTGSKILAGIGRLCHQHSWPFIASNTKGGGHSNS